MHTKGKWDIFKSTEGLYAVITENFDETIAIMNKDNEQPQANAKRIVQMHNSFDDLLEACRDALASVTWFGVNDTLKDVRSRIESAIAKAEQS